MKRLLRDLTVYALSIAAEIIIIIPWRNGSGLQEVIITKSRFSERDTELRVKFQELKPLLIVL